MSKRVTRGGRIMVPSKQDTQQAKKVSSVMLKQQALDHHCQLTIGSEETQKVTVDLPSQAYGLLSDVMAEWAAGKPVTLSLTQEEMTTQEAADMLNVSRPYFIKMLDEGKLPSRKVGKHRRVLTTDVMRYKDETYKQREAVLDELVRQAQELKMGYEND